MHNGHAHTQHDHPTVRYETIEPRLDPIYITCMPARIDWTWLNARRRESLSPRWRLEHDLSTNSRVIAEHLEIQQMNFIAMIHIFQPVNAIDSNRQWAHSSSSIPAATATCSAICTRKHEPHDISMVGRPIQQRAHTQTHVRMKSTQQQIHTTLVTQRNAVCRERAHNKLHWSISHFFVQYKKHTSLVIREFRATEAHTQRAK